MDFVSDHLALVCGLAAALVAALAWWGDRRRLHRRDRDRVGIMPWTGLFFWATLLAVLLLAVAGQEWLGRK
ncbi:hypothetical protein H7F51_05665 [Novosphingobium flavum]|uniref:Uncharacterized protein n=1 Tax=Novosphingobium flavum TaxID=1778672 RepID=A0A7X1KL89_9SPHN|nr:hypothetical protein [Novosphingobium flavum]MBC2664995.1 hypothetical protein [Novosphingobium flavum]